MNKLFANTAAAALLSAMGLVVAQVDVGITAAAVAAVAAVTAVAETAVNQ